ncbi:COG1361 S-layer family protein [Halorubrum halodurans]|uniref:COG1361 S-layer family protein n=1 Tax=Halorubrum halodurans TaxID=1383851 RepID=UPI001179F8AD|nr:NEW3 domain-containing protein [Halorubrum halodurans]
MPNIPFNRRDDDDTRDTRSRIRRSVILVLFLTVVLLLTPISGIGLVDAQETTSDDRFVRGEPDLDVHVPSNTVAPGQTQAIELFVTNDGEIQVGSVNNRNTVTKARNVRATVEADDDSPITVETGTQAVGSVTNDQPKGTSFRLTVPEDADPGEYDLDVELDYSFTRQISDRSGITDERSASETRTVTIEIDDDAQFIVRNTSTSAQIGDSGELSLEMENVGTRTAYNASVRTTSTNGNVVFGESAVDETHAGSWEPGEVKRVTHDVSVRDDTSVRPYTFDTAVSFDDRDGIENVDDGISSSVSPLPAQAFEVELTESTLRVDEEGWIRGEVTNTGPATAESVELRAPLADPNLYPIENSYAVGTLEPGETASFALRLDVGGEAEAIRKLIDVDVRYRTMDRNKRVDDDGDVIVDVQDRRSEFRLASQQDQITAGETETITIEVTNNLDETVTDIEPKLFTDDPLSAPDDIAFVPELKPGETTTIRFEVSVGQDTVPKTYAATVDMRYDDADGESQISDTHRVTITVGEPAETTNPLLIGVAVALLVVLTAGLYAWRLR